MGYLRTSRVNWSPESSPVTLTYPPIPWERRWFFRPGKPTENAFIEAFRALADRLIWRAFQMGAELIQAFCRSWTPAGIVKVLSLDLRGRVLAAAAGGSRFVQCRE